jgi:hypothetical protein
MPKSLGRLVVSAIVLGLSTFAFALSAEAAAPSAAALLSSAVHDAIAGRGVHEVSVARRSGETLKMINDIATNEGRQEITLSDGSSVEVIAFDAQLRAYIKGNQIGLKNYSGFPASEARKYAEKWMSANPGDHAWENIIGYTTLKSDFETNLAILHPVLNANVVSINGVGAYEITGHVAATANSPAATVKLYVSDKGTVLPIRLIEHAKGVTATVNWSKWGESLALRTPAKSVPLP